jgi:transposase
MSKAEQLTDEQWAVLEPLIPKQVRRADGRGRPETHSDRAVLNGILWVLRTGAAWADLPDRFPSGSTCFRRFSRWVKAGVLRTILEALARDLEERGGIDLSECFIDGTFTVAKKGGSKSERPSGARVRSSWLLQTLLVFHSPCTRLLLRHMKSPLSRRRSLKPSPWDDPDDLWGIVPTTVIRSIRNSLPKALN